MTNRDSNKSGGEAESDDFDVKTDSSLMRGIRAGNDQAAEELFERYAKRLQSLANRQMAREISGRIDPEDVTQSIFRTLFRRLQAGQYSVPQGDSIWRLLVTIALNKIRSVGAFHRAAKRDIRKSASLEHETGGHASGDELAVNVLRMTIDELLSDLSESQKQIIQLRLEGNTVAEISKGSGRSRRTVERTLQGFRQTLAETLNEEDQT